MAATTPVYSIPYPTGLDAPDGPEQLEAMAFLLEGEIQRIDTSAGTLQGQANSTDASLTSHVGATTAHGVTGAVVGTSGAQTLTGKVIDGNSNTLTVLKAQIVGAPVGAFVGVTDGQTLSGKVMSGASNSFSNIPQSAVVFTNTSSTLAAAAGWAASYSSVRKFLGSFVYFESRFTRTGAAITDGSGVGNITDVNLATLPSGYRPISTIWGSYVATQTDGGAEINSSGVISLKSLNPGAQIANGHEVWINMVFMV